MLDADGLEDEAIPAVAYVYAPGSGIKKRRYITLRFEDAVKLLGPTLPDASEETGPRTQTPPSE
jgi:hypothetical protein